MTRSRKRARVLGALAGAATLGLIVGGIVWVATPASVATTAIGAPPSVLASAHPTSAPLPKSLQVSIVLEPADPAGLEAYATASATPGDRRFRQFLTPSQVEARFGPPPPVIGQVRRWLSSNHLSLGATTGDGMVIPATGTPSQVAAAFETSFHSYAFSSGPPDDIDSTPVYAATSAARVPSSLAPAIEGIVGLDDLTSLRPAEPPARPVPAASSTDGPTSGAADLPATAGPQPCAAAIAGALSPSRVPLIRGHVQSSDGPAATAEQLASALGYTPLYRKGDLGQGVTVGVVAGGGDYADSDLRTYEACYGIDTSVTRVPVDGGAAGSYRRSGTRGVDSNEVTLDVESVVGMAPAADVLVYEAPSFADAPMLDALATVVQADEAQVVNGSFGYCEALSTDARSENVLFEEMAAQGQTMLVGAGDNGSTACAENGYFPEALQATLAVDDPGSQPFVTSVGGVYLSDLSDVSGATVWAWNWGPVAGGTAAGTGGASSIWAMPAWQAGADRDGGATGPQGCSASGSSPCREVPDVSTDADYRNGLVLYSCVVGSSCKPGSPAGWRGLPAGGTSLASPLLAGLTALVDEGVPGGRVGLLAPSLYRIAASDPSAFVDVTQGSNATFPGGAEGDDARGGSDACSSGSRHDQPCYEATPGYDMATGLGVPVGNIVAADIRALGPGTAPA